jgi:hypothetical protein
MEEGDMAETAPLETHEALPPPAARRDVRVVTPGQLQELRREQQEIYQSLRSSGFGPSDAARQIGIPRSLADEWERPAAPARAGSPAPAPAKDEPAPAGWPAAVKELTSADPQSLAAKAGSPSPEAKTDGQTGATTAGAAPAETPARPTGAPRVVRLDDDAADLARQARECAQRVQRELTALKRLMKRLEAATAVSPDAAASPGSPGSKDSKDRRGVRTKASAPDGTTAAGIPPRAARSSLTTVLLRRGRARQHPAPPSRA